MHYKKRELEKHINNLFEIFPIVAITGPRQSGKTTLLQHYKNKNWQYFSLDNRDLLARIQNDPELFTAQLDSNTIIDEAQKAPELFHSIKGKVDQHFPFKIILSGSADFLLLKTITESLAGRVGLLTLLPFSISESLEKPANNLIEKIITSLSITELKEKLKNLNFIEEKIMLNFILYGGYPKIYNLEKKDLSWQWLSSYISTYIERDVRYFANITNLNTFQNVYKMLAFYSGNILKMSNIANDLDVSVNTVKRYISILQASYQNFLLQSYYMNQKKQIIKSPKIFNLDTGILNFLLKNDSLERMLNCGSWGSILETFVFTELYKELSYLKIRPALYYWRTNNQAEIDFIIESQNRVYPIEVKSAIQIRPFALRGLKSFMASQPPKKVPFGIVLYRGREIHLIEPNILAVPLGLLS
jgi:uncharacterized protein